MLKNLIDVINSNDFVVLDTETTGLHDGEIVQIAIIDHDGNVLIDTLVKPQNRVPEEAIAVHGLTNERLAKVTVQWSDVSPVVENILRGKNVIVYNAIYDRKMMHQSAEKSGLQKVDWKSFSNWLCAMEAFAEFYGDWNDYYGSYRWKPLDVAAQHCNVPVSAAHSALGDCLVTLHVCRYMAGKGIEDD